LSTIKGSQPKNEELEKLLRYGELLRTSLSLSKDQVNFMEVRKNPTDKGSVTMFENEGALAGENWKEYNPNRFIRVLLSRPRKKSAPFINFTFCLLNF
jgi:hypothetical protein